MRTNKESKPNIELIVTGILGVFSIVTFGLHISWSDKPLTEHETALFSILEFVLTLGFGWFSTRAISRMEFNENLKRFAISAYRRVADVNQLLIRLQDSSRRIARAYEGLGAELTTIEAIAADASQLVQSSISDWSDVIGEEQVFREKLGRLERDRALLRFEISTDTARPDAQRMLRRLNQEIDALIESNRAHIRYEIQRAYTEHDDRHAAGWIAREHRKQGGFRLHVVVGDKYHQERGENSIKQGEVLRLNNVKQSDGAIAIDVIDEHGANIGRMQNGSPLGYDDFMAAMEICYGNFPISAQVVKVIEGEVRSDGRYYSWVEIKVLREPTIEAT